MQTDQSDNPRVFTLYRHNDESGISGRGRVLDGIEFPDGKVVICWRVAPHAIGMFDSFAAFRAIHVDSHPTNMSEIVWLTSININSAPAPSVFQTHLPTLAKLFKS